MRPENDDPEPRRRAWQQSAGDDPGFELQILESPDASPVAPFAECVDSVERRDPDPTVTVVMPDAIPRHNLDDLLLNQRAINRRMALNQHHNRIFTMVRYHLTA